MYQQAMVQGASAMQLAITGDNAGTRAAYDQSFNDNYATEMNRFNAAKARHAIQGNMAAAMQDRVLTDMEIQRSQAIAEANATVAAAAAGVEGMSVDQGIDQTKLNATRAQQANDKATKQEISSLVSGLGVHQAALLAEAPKQDFGNAFDAVLTAVGSVDLNDIKRGKTMYDDYKANQKQEEYISDLWNMDDWET